MKLVSTKQLTQLIDIHLGELKEKNPAWVLEDSPISGRGIFAARDISVGEIILREKTLLVGPTARKEDQLHTCVICYHLIDGDPLCAKGCTLPVCKNCSDSVAHANECHLFRKWKPKDRTKTDVRALRVLSVIRCFFLNEDQRNLLYALQANGDQYYLKEIARAAETFEHFPKDPDLLEYFHRTVCVFNTNAFEGNSEQHGHEVLVRALFPLAGILNHQCTPNVSHHFESAEQIVLTATRNIAKGEEITTTYTKVLWSNLARRIFLSLTKHFICKCQRCCDPTVSFKL